MTFTEALMLFCNRFCAMRSAKDDPVMLSEFANGLTVVVIAMLESMSDEHDRALVREAIKSALDEAVSVDREQLN